MVNCTALSLKAHVHCLTSIRAVSMSCISSVSFSFNFPLFLKVFTCLYPDSIPRMHYWCLVQLVQTTSGLELPLPSVYMTDHNSSDPSRRSIISTAARMTLHAAMTLVLHWWYSESKYMYYRHYRLYWSSVDINSLPDYGNHSLWVLLALPSTF